MACAQRPSSYVHHLHFPYRIADSLRSAAVDWNRSSRLNHWPPILHIFLCSRFSPSDSSKLTALSTGDDLAFICNRTNCSLSSPNAGMILQTFTHLTPYISYMLNAHPATRMKSEIIHILKTLRLFVLGFCSLGNIAAWECVSDYKVFSAYMYRSPASTRRSIVNALDRTVKS